MTPLPTISYRRIPGGPAPPPRPDPEQDGASDASQQEPVVAGMFYQPSAGLHQPLLQAGQQPLKPASQKNNLFEAACIYGTKSLRGGEKRCLSRWQYSQQR